MRKHNGHQHDDDYGLPEDLYPPPKTSPWPAIIAFIAYICALLIAGAIDKGF